MNQQRDMFIPDVFPSEGRIGIHQAGKFVYIPDADFDRFLEDLQAARRKQLIDDCRRIAVCGA